ILNVKFTGLTPAGNFPITITQLEGAVTRTITFALTVLLVVSASSSSATAANVYYVATSGNDAVSCTTTRNDATPKRTISNAIGCLGAGDTLYIRAGTYDEQIQDRTSFGTATRPITIAGYPGDARPLIKPGPSTGDPALGMVWWIAYENRVSRYLTIRHIEI